ncbi:hypothetical protein GCM10011414_13020 [Croceivirga lutea]|nr:hypothetical protein GCM10011414_13020 [Croceivirga lutea]
MLMKRLFFILITLFFLSNAFGQETVAFNADSLFLKARSLAFNNQRVEARDSLQKLLEVYPEYVDAELLLAKTLSWDGDYAQARKHFNRLTSKEKKSQELWVAAVKNEIYAENHAIALGLANKALTHIKNDPELTSLKHNSVSQIYKDYEIYEVLKTENAETDEKNSFSVTSTATVFDKTFDPFYEMKVAYARKAKWGVLIPRITYAERFDIQGYQFEVDAYPTFSKKLHGYLNYGFSDQIIFPKHRIGAELYSELPKAREASLGLRHLRFNEVNTTIITGSYGLYTGNWYFSGRPFVSFGNDDVGFAGSLLARKYFKDANNYLDVNFTYGIDVDNNQFFARGQLLAESVTYLSTQRLRFAYQFTLVDKVNSINTSLNLSRQELPFSPNDFVFSATVGLQYKFQF